MFDSSEGDPELAHEWQQLRACAYKQGLGLEELARVFREECVRAYLRGLSQLELFNRCHERMHART
jgi:hypothetical protein